MYAAMAEALLSADGDGSVGRHPPSSACPCLLRRHDIKDFAGFAASGTSARTCSPSCGRSRSAKAAGRRGGWRRGRRRHDDAPPLRPCAAEARSAKLSTPSSIWRWCRRRRSSLLAPRIMGHARAFEMLVMGRPFSPDQAVAAESPTPCCRRPRSRRRASIAGGPRSLRSRARRVKLSRRLIKGSPDEILARIDEEAQLFARKAALGGGAEGLHGVPEQGGVRRMTDAKLGANTSSSPAPRAAIGPRDRPACARVTGPRSPSPPRRRSRIRSSKARSTRRPSRSRRPAARPCPSSSTCARRRASLPPSPRPPRPSAAIDIVVNNASAINLSNTEAVDMKRYDLMNGINARGTFMVSKIAIPHLAKAENPHILMLSPPARHEREMVRAPSRLFDRQVRHEPLRSRPRRRAPTLGHRRQRALAAHHHATAAVNNLLGGDALMKARARRRSWPTRPTCFHDAVEGADGSVPDRRHLHARPRRHGLRQVPRRPGRRTDAGLLRARRQFAPVSLKRVT